MPNFNTRDIDSLSGAIYFVVGLGTEGGPSSYHLSIAGITSGTSEPHWGDARKIVADSGYSLGTIQVDLGKRGTWVLGSTDAASNSGADSYVDGIIDQSMSYAAKHGLKFSDDVSRLRSDLLSHGNGEHGRSTLTFIDKDTYNSINAWASSKEGQSWVHKNVDYPQIRHATERAFELVNTYGKNISEDHRLETIAILAKTENQMPSQVKNFENLLRGGGDYDDMLAKANEIKNKYSYYDGPKAAVVAQRYAEAYVDPEKAAALDRAQGKVSSPIFDPGTLTSDADLKEAQKAIGHHGQVHALHDIAYLRIRSRGEKVSALQDNLFKLGYRDERHAELRSDGNFGAITKRAVEQFQNDHQLKPDGVVGAATQKIIDGEILKLAKTKASSSLADPAHPGNALYRQSLDAVYRLDAQQGRIADQRSENLAGMLTVAAQARGFMCIDQVLLSDDASRVTAVDGKSGSLIKLYAGVDVVQAINTPLEQSSRQWRFDLQPAALAQGEVPMQLSQKIEPSFAR